MASLAQMLMGGTPALTDPNASVVAPTTPTPTLPFQPDSVIAQQYKLADALRQQRPASSWAGVLAHGLGAVGGNFVQGNADEATRNNADMRKTDIANASSATDLPSLEKSLIGAQTPDIQSLGLQTKIKTLSDDPNKDYRIRAAQAIQNGLKPGTPEFRSYVLAGQLPTPKDPLDQEYKRAQIDALRNKTNDVSTPAGRAAAAAQFGLDPNSDAGRAYILTGKLPREDQQALTATDKKAILEADEKVSTNQNVLNALDEATQLNDKAYSGATAGVRTWLGNNLWDYAVPDFIASPETAAATTNLDNATTTQALTQLKAIFGGNPTEGERKILLDLQGSSSKPTQVRAEIMQRAKTLAQARLSMNQREADQLRGGTFYKPGGGTSGGAISSAHPPAAKAPQETKVINGATYVKIDGQWYAQ